MLDERAPVGEEMKPLVSCICPTMASRADWLPRAIACFLEQTYEPRELVIVPDSDQSLPAMPEDPRIRVVPFAWRDVVKPLVGRKRNFACEVAAGEVIAHWDDDDYSAPERLAVQVEKLASSGKAVTGFHAMKFTDGETWWEYRGGGAHGMGNSLCYLRDWWRTHPFPESKPSGEDSSFVGEAVRQRMFAAMPDMALMYATVHAGNTSKRSARPDFQELAGFRPPASFGMVGDFPAMTATPAPRQRVERLEMPSVILRETPAAAIPQQFRIVHDLWRAR